MLKVSPALKIGFMAAYSSQSRPLGETELQLLAFRIFRHRISPAQVRSQLLLVRPECRGLFAFSLRVLNTGHFHFGSLKELRLFCEKQLPDVNFNNWPTDPNARDNYLYKLEFKFPEKLDYAARAMMFTYLEHFGRVITGRTYQPSELTRIFDGPDMWARPSSEIWRYPPLLVLDGPSSAGKSTIIKNMAGLPELFGFRPVVLGLDMFLKDPSQLAEISRKWIRGETPAATFDELSFWDIAGFKAMLTKIADFRTSRQKIYTLKIPRAYDPETSSFGDREFTLTPDTLIIIEGKYAYLAELLPFYGKDAFRCRLMEEFWNIWDNHAGRKSRIDDREYKQKRLQFMAQVLYPQFTQYAAETSRCLNAFLNLSPDSAPGA
jgi:hypothetical protein